MLKPIETIRLLLEDSYAASFEASLGLNQEDRKMLKAGLGLNIENEAKRPDIELSENVLAHVRQTIHFTSCCVVADIV